MAACGDAPTLAIPVLRVRSLHRPLPGSPVISITIYPFQAPLPLPFQPAAISLTFLPTSPLSSLLKLQAQAVDAAGRPRVTRVERIPPAQLDPTHASKVVASYLDKLNPTDGKAEGKVSSTANNPHAHLLADDGLDTGACRGVGVQSLPTRLVDYLAFSCRLIEFPPFNISCVCPGRVPIVMVVAAVGVPPCPGPTD